uniref:Doublesex- and mab-3-related transcription factor C1/C2 C-terminal domain-containing protein n=1 Tax=Phocoena sinus TaxID=42100 RepID=A0A8C9E9M9_PHOSS
TLKSEQGPLRKRHLTEGLIRSGTTSPKAHSHVNKLAIQAGASSQGALLMGLASESLSLSWTPAPLKKQLTISLSRKTHRLPALPSRCSTLILQPCATLNPLLLQPRILGKLWTSDQVSVSASSEWQRKLEAAEALLALRESSQAPSGSISVLHPFFVSTAPAVDRGLQPSNPSLGPAPASSVSLPNGHLGCISPLS